jgi:PD-(D/E)XK nuclease superfamily/Restriction Enzyme Adenine Methylase Associated
MNLSLKLPSDFHMNQQSAEHYGDAAFSDDLHRLLTDQDFLQLEHSISLTSLFETLAASHLEMWHSAFLKWLLDPQSHLGLDDFPLKRFLSLALRSEASATTGYNDGKLTVADVECADLRSVALTNEEPIILASGETRRIDVLGRADKVAITETETRSFLLIIENKVEAKEQNDQTAAYSLYAEKQTSDWKFRIFLTPRPDEEPKSKSFTKVTYQELHDYVLAPCLAHPQVPAQSKYLLEQYILNLSRPLKNRKPMANTRESICRKIFKAHETVLNEILTCVKKETIESPGEGGSKRFIAITLQDLVERGGLALDDRLYSNKKNKPVNATLKKTTDGSVVVVYEGNEYDTPSGAAVKAADVKAMNGWDYWSVKAVNGAEKGTLSEIRAPFAKEIENKNL